MRQSKFRSRLIDVSRYPSQIDRSKCSSVSNSVKTGPKPRNARRGGTEEGGGRGGGGGGEGGGGRSIVMVFSVADEKLSKGRFGMRLVSLSHFPKRSDPPTPGRPPPPASAASSAGRPADRLIRWTRQKKMEKKKTSPKPFSYHSPLPSPVY